MKLLTPEQLAEIRIKWGKEKINQFGGTPPMVGGSWFDRCKSLLDHITALEAKLGKIETAVKESPSVSLGYTIKAILEDES